MARKVISRKEKRAEVEAAEAVAKTKKKTAKKKTVKKKTVKKKAVKKKKKAVRKKKVTEIRLKAFWGVFNQSLKRVALYEYADRKKAVKRAKELSESGNKTPHFVQPVKEEIKLEEE